MPHAAVAETLPLPARRAPSHRPHCSLSHSVITPFTLPQAHAAPGKSHNPHMDAFQATPPHRARRGGMRVPLAPLGGGGGDANVASPAPGVKVSV